MSAAVITAASEGIAALKQLVSKSQRLLVITGAGISTDSGIPDYRSPGRPPHNPIQYSGFMGAHATRQRYWARSMFGFRHLSQAQPNVSHLAIARARDRIHHVITQNVDGLHQRAGSENVINLHGSIHSVVCTKCKITTKRSELQDRLVALNPSFKQSLFSRSPPVPRATYEPLSLSAPTLPVRTFHAASSSTPSPPPAADVEDAMSNSPQVLRPDGDIQLGATDFSSFNVPECLSCGGILKPDVVFFGENVPSPVANRASELATDADAIMVVGSSLATWSAFRFIKRASERKQPVAILNDGPSRGDEYASIRVTARTAAVLPALFD